VASYQERCGVTLSLSSVVGRGGVLSVLEPAMSGIERRQFQRGVERLKSAVGRVELSATGARGSSMKTIPALLTGPDSDTTGDGN
jgi:hypothetical protein